MTLDEIKKEWEKDCEIDDIELDKSSLEVPKLHAKYQDLLSSKILVMKSINSNMITLLKISGCGITEKWTRTNSESWVGQTTLLMVLRL